MKHNQEKNWVLVHEDNDGIIGFTAVHRLDVSEFKSGTYWGGITKGYSLRKEEIENLVKELNEKNEPRPVKFIEIKTITNKD